MAPHITAHDPIMPRKSRYPVIPELGATTDTVLEPYRLLFGYPRVGVVVDLVIHLAIVGNDFRHTLLLIVLCAKCCPRPGSGGNTKALPGLPSRAFVSQHVFLLSLLPGKGGIRGVTDPILPTLSLSH